MPWYANFIATICFAYSLAIPEHKFKVRTLVIFCLASGILCVSSNDWLAKVIF